MLPIFAKYYNSIGKSDFTAGFVPDLFDEDTWNMPKKPLGDSNEALLGTAIRLITGEKIPQAPTTRSARLAPSLGSSLDNKAWSNQIIMPKNR